MDKDQKLTPPLTFRLCQVLVLNRPINRETDHITLGAYNLEMEDKDGSIKDIFFDFEDFEAHTDSHDPTILNCVQKNPDTVCYGDLFTVTEHMLRNVRRIKEWNIDIESDDSNPLQVTNITDATFEIINDAEGTHAHHRIIPIDRPLFLQAESDGVICYPSENDFVKDLKDWYIVPNTRGYHAVVKATSEEDALVRFADTMDLDMSAYFDATEKEPAAYPYLYESPDGKFETAICYVIAILANDRDSQWHMDAVLEDGCSLKTIGTLQEAYDAVIKTSMSCRKSISKHFYKILKKITGFRLPKEMAESGTARILVPEEDVSLAANELDEAGIEWDQDSYDRFMVSQHDLDNAIRILEEAGIDADII